MFEQTYQSLSDWNALHIDWQHRNFDIESALLCSLSGHNSELDFHSQGTIYPGCVHFWIHVIEPHIMAEKLFRLSLVVAG